MEGLWISRFFPKSTTPLMICDHLNEIGGSQLHSTDFSMLPHSHKSITYLHNCKIEETGKQSSDDLLLTEAKKLQNCINKEASTGFKDDKGKDDHTSKHNFNTVTPFPRHRDSEAMASEIRCHSIYANKQNRYHTTQVNMSCLFYETRGYQLVISHRLQEII